MDIKHTTVTTHEGPIFVGACERDVSLSVNIDMAYVHTFLTPGETTQLIAAIQDTLKVVTP